MLTVDFRQFTKSLITDNDYRRVAEIGVWKGQLSRILWALPSIDHLLLVDPFDAEATGMKEVLTQDELNAIHYSLMMEKPKHVHLIRLPSVDAAATLTDLVLDFVFIDAFHTYGNVYADIQAWMPKIRAGGMIAGDDYSNRFPGVKQAVTELLPNHQTEGRVWFASL